MIEIIKALVEAIVTGIPGIRAAKREKKFRKLGVDLFLLYVKLNEVTLTAGEIIHQLEDFTTRTEQEVSEGDYWSDSRIRRLVSHQSRKLEEVLSLLDFNSILVQVLEPQAYNQIVPLLAFKNGAIRTLQGILITRHLPLDPTRDEVEDWSLRISRRNYTTDRARAEIDHHIQRQGWRWRETALHLWDWDADTQAQIVQYLERRQPREQLEEIKSALALLRSSLMENFTMADILLEVER
ncbi:hypothetical protein [Streptomyces sioyaensis]|uniref:hypothetical protein n=1 Tax=Streptomyces sioyaensis TaxID=67364 RepID=UPI0037A5593E